MNGPCGFCPVFTALGLPEFFTQDALFALQEHFLRQSMCPWGQTAKWQLGTTTLSHPSGPLSSGDQTCHRNPQMTDGQKPPEDRRPTPPRPSRPLPHGARSPRRAPHVLGRRARSSAGGLASASPWRMVFRGPHPFVLLAEAAARHGYRRWPWLCAVGVSASLDDRLGEERGLWLGPRAAQGGLGLLTASSCFYQILLLK